MTESGRRSSSPDDHGDSKSAYRKSNKPLMEKRRRARINTCLTELKNLVLQAMKKDNAQYSKLEKADILELTVKHLRTLQRQQMTDSLTNSSVIHKYRAGFNECAGEVMRYLSAIPGVQDEVKGRVLGHLANCMQTVNVAPTPARHLIPPPPLLHPGQLPATETPTAFHPVSRDHCNHTTSGQPSSFPANLSTSGPQQSFPTNHSVSGQSPSFPTHPVQLVQTSGSTAPVAFVLTSPSQVQAVPVYASSPPFNGHIKTEPKDTEDCSAKDDNSDVNSDIKPSAFKHFTSSSPVQLSPRVPEAVVVKEQHDEPMWRPW